MRENKQANVLKDTLHTRAFDYAMVIELSPQRLISFLSMGGGLILYGGAASVQYCVEACRGDVAAILHQKLRGMGFTRDDVRDHIQALWAMINGWAFRKEISVVEKDEEVQGATRLGQFRGRPTEQILDEIEDCGVEAPVPPALGAALFASPCLDSLPCE